MVQTFVFIIWGAQGSKEHVSPSKGGACFAYYSCLKLPHNEKREEKEKREYDRMEIFYTKKGNRTKDGNKIEA